MNPLTVVALLHYFLFVVQSAPIASSGLPPAFTEAADRARTLVEKILKDVAAAHAATVSIEGLTLDPSTQTTNLQMMVTSLGIPSTPVLKPPSQHFTLDVCVSRMSAGSRLHQGLLGVLSNKLSGLSVLQADIRDLQTHFNKMRQAAQLDAVVDQDPGLDLASRLDSDYNVQVAAHLTLQQLRSFCHDLMRSLRAIGSYRRQAAGAR